MNEINVSRVADFEVTGDGANPAWSNAEWHALTRVWNGRSTYTSRFKTLYSDTGIYFLIDCPDRRLTCTIQEDNRNLYTEDVVEVFLWTDEAHPIYFEYELSPLNHELPIIVPNNNGRFHGWLPWKGVGPRATRHATAVRGGPKEGGASVEGWRGEFFIPFELLQGLGNECAAPGMTWRANVYRIDYDDGEASHWAWNPEINASFHDFRHFGAFHFV